MEEKDDWTCGREGDRHPFTEINLQDEFVTPIMLVLNYRLSLFLVHSYHTNRMSEKFNIFILSSAKLTSIVMFAFVFPIYRNTAFKCISYRM